MYICYIIRMLYENQQPNVIGKKQGHGIEDKIHCNNKKGSYCRGDYQFSKVASQMSDQLDG